MGKLKAAGYSPTIQTFQFPFYAQLGAPILTQTSPEARSYGPGDFATMTYSGAGNITGAITTVHTTGAASAATTSGCETSDFAAFESGSIELVQRGTCPFSQKAANAQAAGSGAVVIFNTGVGGSTGPIAGTLGAPQRTPSPRTGTPTTSSPRRPRAVPTTW